MNINIRNGNAADEGGITTGNKKAVGTHEIKMHIEVFDDGRIEFYMSDRGLKEGAREELKGKTFLDFFPTANEPGSFWNLMTNGADASAIPIVVLTDDEYNERFPDDEEEPE